jgi:hypothetical protein
MKMDLRGLVFVDWIYVAKCGDIPAPSHVLKDYVAVRSRRGCVSAWSEERVTECHADPCVTGCEHNCVYVSIILVIIKFKSHA